MTAIDALLPEEGGVLTPDVESLREVMSDMQDTTVSTQLGTIFTDCQQASKKDNEGIKKRICNRIVLNINVPIFFKRLSKGTVRKIRDMFGNLRFRLRLCHCGTVLSH